MRQSGGKEPMPLGELEKRLSESLRSLATDARGENVLRAREVLADLIEKIEIDRKLCATVRARASFLREHEEYIPRGI